MQENILGYEGIPKLLRTFAIPSITAMVVSSLYNIVDQIFIGQGVGYLGNAATNVSFPLTTICMAIALLLGIGSASRFSLYLGKGMPDKAAAIAGNGILLMMLTGVIYMAAGLIFLEPLLTAFGATPDVMPYALEYSWVIMIGMPFQIVTNGVSSLIRADGSPTYSMLCMVAGAIANTILDPLFIFGFNWGVFGAALATILGQMLSFVIAILYLKRFKTVKIAKSSFRINLRESARTCSMGISASINQVAITLVQIVLNNSMTYYGAMTAYGSDIPLAACGIVMKTNGILFAVIIGIAQGSQPIVGFNYGAEKYERVRKTFMLSMKWNLVVSAIGFCLFQFCPHVLISIFGSGDELYFEFSIMFMRIFLLMALVNGVQILTSNFFTSIGKALTGLLVSLTRQIIFLIPLVLILPHFFGIMGILYAGPISDGAAFVLAVFLLVREFKRQKALIKAKEKTI